MQSKTVTLASKEANFRPSGKESEIKDIVLRSNILRKQCEALKLDAFLANVLSITNTDISITIGPKGTRFSIVNSKGEDVCDLTEIQNLGSFRRFQSSEVKADAAFTSMLPVLKFFFGQAERDGEEPTLLSANQIASGKELVAQIETLKKNYAVLKKYTGEHAGEVAYLLEIVSRMFLVMSDMTYALRAGQNEKGLLNGFLSTRSVPRWFKSKLLLNKLQESTEFDPRRFLFPVDSFKGITLMRSEWLSYDMKRVNHFVLKNSGVIINAMLNDAFIRDHVFSGFNPEDTSSADALALLEAPFTVIPLWYGSDFLFGPKTKGKYLSVKVITGTSVISRAMRTNVAFIRAFALEVETNDNIRFVFTKLFPEERARFSGASESNMFLVGTQIPEWENRMKDFCTFSKKDQGLYLEMLAIELRMSLTDAIRASYLGVMFAPGEKVATDDVVTGTLGVPYISLTVERLTTGTDPVFLAKFNEALPKMISAPKAKRTQKTTAITRLSRKLVDSMSDLMKSNKVTGTLVQSWLGTFKSEKFQAVALNLVLAEYERNKQISFEESDDELPEENEKEEA